jgi:hypothetical protein
MNKFFVCVGFVLDLLGLVFVGFLFLFFVVCCWCLCALRFLVGCVLCFGCGLGCFLVVVGWLLQGGVLGEGWFGWSAVHVGN